MNFPQNGQFLYESHLPDGIVPAEIVQYDLSAPNPSQSRFVVKTWPLPAVGTTAIGGLQLWLDDKIYVGTSESFSTYPDTFYVPNIINLSRIEDPDLPGAMCNFDLNCVYLNGKRNAGGLPNNPNYELKEWTGSGCDTVSLTGINEHNLNSFSIELFPVPISEDLTIQTGQPLKESGNLDVYNSDGKLIFKESLIPNFYRKTLNVGDFAPGLYLVVIQSENAILSKKFQKL